MMDRLLPRKPAVERWINLRIPDGFGPARQVELRDNEGIIDAKLVEGASGSVSLYFHRCAASPWWVVLVDDYGRAAGINLAGDLRPAAAGDNLSFDWAVPT